MQRPGGLPVLFSRAVGPTRVPLRVGDAARPCRRGFAGGEDKTAGVARSPAPKKIPFAASLVLFAAVFGGCLADEEPEGPGFVAVYMLGDAGLLDRLEVTVSAVHVVTPALLSEAQATQDPNNRTDPVGGATFHPVDEEATTVVLSGPEATGAPRLAAEGEVDSGRYTHLVIEFAAADMDGDADPRAVQIPRPYLVLSGPFDVDPEEITQFLIDMDVSASLMSAGASASDAAVVLDPEVEEVRVGQVEDTDENREDLQADALERKAFMVHTAEEVRIERGALMLLEPLLKQRADVGVDLRLDLNGDGRADETLVNGAGPSGAIPTATATTTVTTSVTPRPTATPTSSGSPSPSPTGSPSPSASPSPSPTASPSPSPSPSPTPTASPTASPTGGTATET